MEIETLRSEIDCIDGELAELLCRRMEISAQIGEYKRERGLPVRDAERERQLVAELCKRHPQRTDTLRAVYGTLLALSRAEQRGTADGAVSGLLRRSAAESFPLTASAACQGAEGAFSQQACERLFHAPRITWFTDFEGVMRAVDSGMCSYGVLPLDNSIGGTVTQVCELMDEYRLSVVRSCRIAANQCLLALPGTRQEDIVTVISHPQALRQCAAFLREIGVRVEERENTALAAREVARRGERGVAAIASAACAELYGLEVLREGVSPGGSFTRFICVSKQPEVYPGADRMSLVLSARHSPGSLFGVLAGFAALGVNLTRLESRLVPGSDFEYRFFIELEGAPEDGRLAALLDSLAADCPYFAFWGAYRQI